MSPSKLELWQNRIEEQRVSGLTIPEWCRLHATTKHTFYYWRKRICLAEQKETSAPQLPEFAELSMKGPKHQAIKADNNCGLRVSWNDVQFQLSDAKDLALAAEFICLLRKSC